MRPTKTSLVLPMVSGGIKGYRGSDAKCMQGTGSTISRITRKAEECYPSDLVRAVL